MIYNDMAIVIVGYDGYSDLWDNYFELFNKYWSDNKYKVYLINNTLKKKYKNVEIINCGEDAEWSKKVRIGIDRIESKYICLLLEDFFIKSKIDTNIINETLKFIKKNNIDYYKLKSFSKISTENYKNIDYLHVIPKKMDYGISLQPAIWEKDYLSKLLGNGNYNAWKFEYDRVKEAKKIKNNEVYDNCIFDSRNIFNIEHGVVQGQFIPPLIKVFDKQNYKFNLEKRKLMSNKDYLIYEFKLRGKQLVPQMFRSPVKKLMSKLGMKFVSDREG